MSDHVTEWLNAYLDRELNSSRIRHVEAHLAECPACQAELESLERVSTLLREVPTPNFTSPDRFAAQVSLRLPHQKTKSPKTKLMEIGWWMIPVGLLATWIFISTFFLLDDLLSTASRFGLLTSVSSWLAFGSPSQAYWSNTLAQFGLLRGMPLDWVATTEVFTRTWLPQITLHVSIALLYLSWIAIWWARHRRPEYGQLLES